mmetsp:Transcript_37831/g.62204  ORF Transcript_37831/g.62204 Transcript_37831/m.62204 type:complete len:438 (+) Transcript_37831:274-1587(+)
MQCRSSGIFEWITDSVASNGSFVCFSVFQVLRFDQFLGIVPCATAIVEEHRHQQSGHRAKLQKSRQTLDAQHSIITKVLSNKAEQKSDRDWHQQCQQRRTNHLLERRPCHNLNALSILRPCLMLHNARNLGKLSSHFIHHFLCCASHRVNTPSRKQKHHHNTENTGDHTLDFGDVDRGHFDTGQNMNLVQKRVEQQETRQCRASHGVSFGRGLRHIAHSIQSIRDHAHIVRLLAHLDDTTSIVRDRSEIVHGQHVHSGAQHTHRGARSTEETRQMLFWQSCRYAKHVTAKQRHANRDCRQRSRLHSDGDTRNNIGAVPSARCSRNLLDRLIGVVSVVLRDEHNKIGAQQTNHAAQRKMPPGSGRYFSVEHNTAHHGEQHNGEQERHSVATLHGHNRIFVGRTRHSQRDTNYRDEEIKRVHNEREENIHLHRLDLGDR